MQILTDIHYDSNAFKLLVNGSLWPPLCLDRGVQVLRMLGKDFPGLIGFQGGSVVIIRLPMQETQVQSLSWEDSLEKGMVTLSSILAWKIWGRKTAGHNLAAEHTHALLI